MPAFNARLGQLSTAARLMARPAHGMSEAERAAGGLRMVRTDRLVLRPMEPSDLAEFTRVMSVSRGHLGGFMPLHIPGESDAALFTRQIRQREAGDATGRDWRRVMFDGDGRLVGGINLNDIRRGLENRAEMTIWISADRAGKGFAREALAAAIGVAFAAEAKYAAERGPMPLGSAGGAGSPVGSAVGLGLDRISALVSRDNTACIRLISRLGFNRAEQVAPLEISIGDRRVPHDEWRLWARVSLLEAKPIAAFPARVGESLRQIEQVERSAEHRRF